MKQRLDNSPSIRHTRQSGYDLDLNLGRELMVALTNQPYLVRQATERDLEILDRLYTANMKGYVERVYPWNPKLFRANFVPQEYQVFERDRQIIGFFKIVSNSKDIYLGEIQIRSQDRNRGIGTELLTSLIKTQPTRRIWLRVIKGNPAINLYRRLGFKVFAETTTHFQMELLPRGTKSSRASTLF